MKSKKVVILGGGFAGVLIAKKLEKKLRNKNIDITLIDKNPFHTMLTELHEVAACRVDESSIRIDFKKIFAGRNVNVVQDNIVSADYEANTLVGQQGSYTYDYLVVATGCKPAFWGVDGAKENSFTLWSYDDAVRLREHILNMFRSASKELDPKAKASMLNFYIIGGGFTGVEMAGELAEFVPSVCEKFSIDPKMVRMTLVDILDKVMPFMPEKAINKAVKRLEKTGVTLSLKTNVVGVGKHEITLSKEGKTISDSTHTVMWVAGTEGSEFAMRADALGIAENSRGRVQTDKHLRSLTQPNVYIAGDNMYFIPEGKDRPVPQMVENCEACAPVIANNIIAELNGKEPTVAYKPAFHGEMVCIGGRYGVANVGTANKKFALPSFLAMFSKHFINIIYFLQILGWHKVFSYMKHEFFTIRDRRSFVGGHFSNRTPVFFIVPLRMFLGTYFLYFAYRRFATGWLTSPQLRNVYYNVAEQFRPPLHELCILNQLRFSIFIMNDTMHMWLQTTPVSWFLQNVVFASCQSEMFFQFLIVGFELLVGLALIAGLFTSLASLGAIFVGGLNLITVGLSIYHVWVPFAGIAFLFTGGKVLSLDYYVMPWLAKRWRNIPFIKKWYLYND